MPIPRKRIENRGEKPNGDSPATAPAAPATKSSARARTLKFLDDLEPDLQNIKTRFWGGKEIIVTPELFEQIQEDAARLLAIAREAREWIEKHGRFIEGRLRVRKSGTLSTENQKLIERLNVADLTLRSFLAAAERLGTGTNTTGVLQTTG